MDLSRRISNVAASTPIGIHAMELKKPYPIIGASSSFGSKVVLSFKRTDTANDRGCLFLDENYSAVVTQEDIENII
jgi:hypothetical protein